MGAIPLEEGASLPRNSLLLLFVVLNLLSRNVENQNSQPSFFYFQNSLVSNLDTLTYLDITGVMSAICLLMSAICLLILSLKLICIFADLHDRIDKIS